MTEHLAEETRATKLGEVLRSYRLHKELGQRELAPMIGISYPTLHRIEHGQAIDAKTLMILLNWLMGAKR